MGTTLQAGNEALYEAAFRTGDYAEAKSTFQRLLEQARESGDRALEAAALDRLGMLAHFRALDSVGSSGPAPSESAPSGPSGSSASPAPAGFGAEQELFERALAIRRELEDSAGVAESLFGLGLVHQVFRNDWQTAMPLYREALDLAEHHGDLLLRSEVHRHIGFYYTASDLQSDQALHHLRISHDLRTELADPRWIPGGTVALGLAEIADGLRDQGLAHIREALQQARDANLTPQRIAWIEDFLRDAEATR
ncbi:tetratricopeptide repeat protein [Symbioplanes lichenis]|uniref:tetratricopeptide repeat protein n=1 Tax=Symbioplanes lichenis TaxID=1629072 RepID=UPI002738651F|nr:tetratricopeptide repeat protein [Actinoplanes lichenis]